MPIADLREGPLFYEEHGAGRPLLFVTGLNGVASHWVPQIAAFSPHRRVIVYDQRGCGRSHEPAAATPVQQMADDVLELLDHLEIGTVDLVGHSTGGAIGQLLAAHHPERIGNLVLLSSWARPDPYFRKIMTLRRTVLVCAGAVEYVNAGSAFLHPAAWMEANQERMAEAEALTVAAFPSPDVVARRIDAVLGFDGDGLLDRIASPTLVMVAADDILTPPRFSKYLADRISGAELVEIAHGAHMFTQHAASEVNGEIARFLERRS